MAIEHEDSHTIATHYAKRRQSAGKCISALVKLFPGIMNLSTNNRLPGSRYLFCMCQTLSNIHVEPSLLMTFHKTSRSSMGADYADEQNNPDTRRGRFIAPTADLSALVDVPLS
jgi:hypothetical protein